MTVKDKIVKTWNKLLRKEELTKPQSLLALFYKWEEEIPVKELEEFKNLKEKEAKYRSHMGMRNALGLWGFSAIAQELMDAGVWHGDDMGCVVTLSFHRHLHRKPWKLEKQAKWYKKYWDNTEDDISYLQVKLDRLQYLKRDGHDISRWE